ncbi:hypothetical protein [Nocardioides plantarum]|uniref:Secreted protein n=1 Tax=Nocardioides plantarum TaxID=29299 RepID=A0ABV5KDI6_9ACTN|nr:hypothetical protein [Nocardioides plantarum]
MSPRLRLRLPVRFALLAALSALAVPAATGVAPGAQAATPAPSVARTPDPSTPDPSATDPDTTPTGWRVTDLGGGRYTVSWTSADPLPTTSDRPTIVGDGLELGPTTIGADRRTVESVVTATEAPDPAELDVLLSGDRLDERGTDRTDVGGGARRDAPPTTPLAAPDPGATGPYAVVTSDYALRSVRLPGMPRGIEMVGHVVEPAADAATGPRPLVLFLHGRHSVCYQPGHPGAYSETWPCAGAFREIPSHLGYDYIQRTLASQGFTTVSVRVNGINAQDYRLDDGGADARAAIVRRHLDHWTTIAAAHQVDLSRVVLVGHSRGGEGVDRASIQIPLDAPYRIVGQVLLAPTDFASHTAPYVPTVTVLPYCDGDVSDLQGQKFTDVGRDLAADDTSLKSSVLVMGANHNYFNTEWTPGSVAPSSDDWSGPSREACGRRDPGRLDGRHQRAVGRAYVAGAVRLFTGEDAYLPLVDGSRTSVPSAAGADVRTHALGGGRDTRRPGIDATPTPAAGGATNRLCVGQTSYDDARASACGRGLGEVVAPHWRAEWEGQPARKFLEMGWLRAGAVGGLRFTAPLDLSADRLELRTIVDPRRGPVDLRVRIADSTGATATLTPEGGSTTEPLLVGESVTKLWAQALLVDATDATGLDLTDVTSVELIAGNARGRIWLADVSAAPDALAAVPATRLPQIDLGELVIDEGNPGGTRFGAVSHRTARVPFTVSGTLTAPARFVLVSGGDEGDRADGSTAGRQTVDLAPGQTSGTIAIDYTADRLDDYDLQTDITAWPVHGLVTDDYLGMLRIDDDDPTPALRVSSPGRVREGSPIVFTVSTDRPVGYALSPFLQIVRSPGRPLRGTDVPRWFLASRGAAGDPRSPLYKLEVYGFAQIDPGERSARLVVPTVKDRVREGSETLSVVIWIDDKRVRRTVTVVDATS